MADEKWRRLLAEAKEIEKRYPDFFNDGTELWQHFHSVIKSGKPLQLKIYKLPGPIRKELVKAFKDLYP